MKKLCVLLLLLLLISLLVLPISANHLTTVIDNAEILSDPLAVRIQVASANCNCWHDRTIPYLVTGTEPHAPDNATVRRICGLDEDSDALVLYVRLYNGTYYYDMYTFGITNDAFTDADIDSILDNPEVYNNLKKGYIVDGYEAFVRNCFHPFIGDYERELSDLEEERAKRAPYVALAVGAGSGAVVAGITVLCVFLAYRKKQHGESYPLDRYAKLDLTQANDIFVGSHVTRVRINTNSSSGGRSGGGGGGGHRGGR